MINLTKAAIEAIQAKARETAQMFVDEFNQAPDPSATDWDSTAWQDDGRELQEAGHFNNQQWDTAWRVYQAELIAETRRLVKNKLTVESSYHPQTGKYRIDSVSGGLVPRKRQFDSHAELIAAVEKKNGRRVTN